MRQGRMTKTEYVDVEVDVEIDVDDVIEFIEDYASEGDLKNIRESIGVETKIPSKTIIDVMKIELFKKASEKYTLDQLEEMLKLEYI